jgi:hypothetical protein
VFVVRVLGWCGLPCRKVLSLVFTISFNVFIFISCHHDHHIIASDARFTYASASYRIAGVASSSSGGADQVRTTRSSGIGGVRGRQARRGSTWVCGPPTQFLRTRQAPEHSKSPTLRKQFLSYLYEFLSCALSIGVEWNHCCIYHYPFHIITYESWVEYCLALLRPVAIGEFRSPEMICGY